MSYERTKKIRDKQRASQKKLHQNRTDEFYRQVDKKRKATIRKKGIKVGRPAGTPGDKTGRYKSCKVCGKDIWVIPSLEETKKTCSRECMYVDPDYIKKLREADRSYTQTSEWNSWLRNPDMPEFRRYRNKVNRLTEQTYIKHMDKINPDSHPRTLCGVDGGYQLDHKKSVKQSFLDKDHPKEVAKLSNLQMLPWKINLEKRCH